MDSELEWEALGTQQSAVGARTVFRGFVRQGKNGAAQQCGHDHQTETRAHTCAYRTARRLNRPPERIWSESVGSYVRLSQAKRKPGEREAWRQGDRRTLIMFAMVVLLILLPFLLGSSLGYDIFDLLK